MKLDVAVEIPDELDLSSLKGVGLQPNEELLPELTGKAPELPPFDQEVYTKLVSVMVIVQFEICTEFFCRWIWDSHPMLAKKLYFLLRILAWSQPLSGLWNISPIQILVIR